MVISSSSLVSSQGDLPQQQEDSWCCKVRLGPGHGAGRQGRPGAGLHLGMKNLTGAPSNLPGAPPHPHFTDKETEAMDPIHSPPEDGKQNWITGTKSLAG